MTKQEAKIQIAKLVEKYQKLLETGKMKNFNEAQTRNEFIEPLFKYLGWDMRNENVENEVTTEESVSNGRVDLAFRFNNIPVMFLEAKAMKVDLDEWKWAEQAINYSWNKNVTWAVLTDFESVKVFNAEIPPKSVSKNLFFEIPCRDFLTRFDQLWLLSKESFELKLLDKEAEKWGKLTQRKPVSEKLFEDLMSWRILLTKDFKKQNDLATDGLDEGVQRILDRLIFIRTAEDRKIEPMTLIGISRSGKANFYKQLTKIFRDFDEGFNSKLFAPHYCEEWVASDKAIGEIIKGLYETKDGYRYDFSAISADVLGGIYEQYLSFVQVRKGEEKAKSKRKSQGIYYTPKYIVEFIVKETLGEVLKSVKSKNVGARHAFPLQNIKILDPACGSGSFLNVAYDKLLEFLEKENSQTSLFERFDILKESIFGVDLDVQAVEIAQLNLLLKVLSQRVKLPTLSHNLMAGNSLVTKNQESFDDYLENVKNRPFDFRENFSSAFEKGGFDIIVGNPPYIKEYVNKSAFDNLHKNPYYQGKMDIWTLFSCVAIDLLKEGGYLSFIAPNNWLTNAGASIFRDKILAEGKIVKFIDFGDFKVFREAGIQTMIFIFKKEKPRKNYKVQYAKVTDKNISEEEIASFLKSNFKAKIEGISSFNAEISPEKLMGKNIVFVDETNKIILNKIESKRNFELTEKEIAQGIVPNPDVVNSKNINKIKKDKINKFDIKVGDGVFVVNSDKFKNNEFVKPLYEPENFSRYYHNPNNSKSLIYVPKGQKPNDEILAHLSKYSEIMKERRENKSGSIEYYNLHWARDEKFFKKGGKIICLRKCVDLPLFAYTENECYVMLSFNVIKTDRINLKFLTGLLNSSLMKYWLKNKGKMQGSNFQLDKEPLLNLPILKPDFEAEKEMVLFVEIISNLHKELQETPPNTDKHNSLKQEITKIDKKIDELVYRIYGLEAEEIAVVES